MATKCGIMFIGLCGHLSTTVMAGAMALKKGLCPPIGLVSETEKFKHLAFTDFSDIVFGGWDIRPGHNPGAALKDTGIDDFNALADMVKDLEVIQSGTFPGIILNAGKAIEKISDTILYIFL